MGGPSLLTTQRLAKIGANLIAAIELTGFKGCDEAMTGVIACELLKAYELGVEDGKNAKV